MGHSPRAQQLQNFVAVLAVVVVAFALFSLLLRSKFLPDPDSFYHVGLSRLLIQQGVPQSFPWLTYTPLAAQYTDQHFLYHVFLLPFVHFLDPLVGGKLATALINAALFGLLAAFFIRFRIRLWPLFIAILLVTNPWLFRIGLVKAPGLSIILLVIGLWLLMTYRIRALAVLAFLYVWTYGGFALLGVLAATHGMVAGLMSWRRRRLLFRIFRKTRLTRPRLSTLWRSTAIRLIIATALGLVAGIIINPFFPQNLYFYWQQLVQIGIVNFRDVVNVGGEWRPYGFIELLANTVFVSIAILLASVLLLIYRRRASPESWSLLLLAAFFFLITLKSRRYVELYVPFAVIASAFALRDAVPSLSFGMLWRKFTTIFFRRTILTTLLTIYILATSMTVIARDMRQLYYDLRGGFSSTYLSGASAYLATHTPRGAIVVHSDWDEFPILFYFNTHNRYIVGLDPTFMYQQDRVKYQRWADLTSGNRDDVTSIVVDELGSSYVLVAKDHPQFEAVMRRQQDFQIVYEDRDASIFQYRGGTRTLLPGTTSGTGNEGVILPLPES